MLSVKIKDAEIEKLVVSGSVKTITAEAMGIIHALYVSLYNDDPCSAADFKRLCQKCAENGSPVWDKNAQLE